MAGRQKNPGTLLKRPRPRKAAHQQLQNRCVCSHPLPDTMEWADRAGPQVRGLKPPGDRGTRRASRGAAGVLPWLGLAGLAILLALAAHAPAPAAPVAPDRAAARALVVQVDGAIGPAMSRYIQQA